jgi:uncharacterized protein with ParB-like and HNH nuclease domain
MENISVKPDTIRLSNLLEEIKRGNISVPIFQRDFVWSKEQMKDLFDSISKGYPIGSFLFWKPEKSYKIMSTIGAYDAPPQKRNYYVLDGFQRITTLLCVLTNPKEFAKTENDIKDFLIYYSLETKEFNFLKQNEKPPLDYIPLYKIADTFEYLEFIQGIRGRTDVLTNKQIKLISNAREINKIFLDYQLSYVEIMGGNIQSAVTIFSRVNSTGTEISKDFMLSALSYNAETDFLLSDSITVFLNQLDIFNFNELKRDTVLNCIANAKERIYFDVSTEDLKNIDLEAFTKSTYIHIQKAIEFLYNRIFILNILLLPYPSQLIFISEYFRLNPNPNEADLKKLENWFWITTYSNYFTIYALSQQRSAYKFFCKFARGQHEDGIFKPPLVQFATPNYPNKLNFVGVKPKALQLFYLKSIVPPEIQLSEGIKEFFIDPASKKDKSPANILLRLASEFEVDKSKKTPDSFIKNSNIETLERHFITKEMLDLYKQGKIEDFLQKREDYMKEKEKAFVEQWDIKYIV